MTDRRGFLSTAYGKLLALLAACFAAPKVAGIYYNGLFIPIHSIKEVRQRTISDSGGKPLCYEVSVDLISNADATPLTPPSPRDQLRRYLGLSPDMMTGAIMRLEVQFEHPSIDKICRHINATIYFSKPIPKEWTVPIQPGYKRVKYAVTVSSMCEHIVNIDILDVMDHE